LFNKGIGKKKKRCKSKATLRKFRMEERKNRSRERTAWPPKKRGHCSGGAIAEEKPKDSDRLFEDRREREGKKAGQKRPRGVAEAKRNSSSYKRS